MGAVLDGSQSAHDRYIFPDENEVVVEAHFRLINIESILQRIFFPLDFLEKIPWEEMLSMPEGGLRLPTWFEYNYLHLHALKEGYKSLKWIIDIALIDAMEEKDENIIAYGILKGGIGLIVVGFLFSLILAMFVASTLI